MKFTPKLKYKGDRNYLHGSDFFSAISHWAHDEFGPEAYLYRLSFRSFARHQCVVVTSKPNTLGIGEGMIKINQDTQLPFWFIETGEAVLERYAYDEDGMVERVEFSQGNRVAVLAHQIPYTTIEQVLAVTKKMHNTVNPDINGKWVFGQLNLRAALPDHFSSLKIEMKSLWTGKFSTNTIFCDDTLIGDIRFIVGRP